VGARLGAHRFEFASEPYEEEGIMQIPGRDAPFHHIDRNTLTRIAPPDAEPARIRQRHEHGE
jgi:hypothetical protein